MWENTVPKRSLSSLIYTVFTGLIKCQEACTDARLFNCRSFAFSSSFSSSFNCYLSDREASNLDTGLDLVRDFDSVVYGRSSYCNGGGYNRGRAEGKNSFCHIN